MLLKIRKPAESEVKLIEILINKSLLQFPNCENSMMAKEMNDGNIGSLMLFPNGFYQKKAGFSKQISECEFLDVDGILVSAALCIDKASGELSELDIWKVDFNPLIKTNIDNQ
jgi:hypothetical protein